MITFDNDIVDYVPASAKHLDIVLHTIDNINATTRVSRFMELSSSQ